jgi:hypothetical protein
MPHWYSGRSSRQPTPAGKRRRESTLPSARSAAERDLLQRPELATQIATEPSTPASSPTFFAYPDIAQDTQEAFSQQLAPAPKPEMELDEMRRVF